MRRLLPAAALLAVFGVISRVLGVIRDRLLTSTFGAGIETDAFLAANRIPDLLYQLLVVGAVSSVFIPAYTALRKDSEAKSERLAANVLTTTILFLTVTSALAAIFAPWLSRVLTGGFDAAGIALTADLMRIQLLSPILLGASSVCSALLQTKGTFWTFAWAPVVYNLGQIFGIAVLADRMGVYGVAWGVAIGSLLHLCVQLPSYLRRQKRLMPDDPLHDAALRKMGRQAAPRIAALTGLQIQLIVETSLASLLAGGSITYMAYGQNLMSVPLGLIGLPIAIAAFPRMSEHAAHTDHDRFRQTLVRSARQTLFWILPASAGLLLLRTELIATLFLSKRFTPLDVAATASVLAFYSLALVTQALIPLYARAFYAQHDTRRPVVAAFTTIILNIVFDLLFILVFRWGVWSLALGYALSTTVGFLMHAYPLRHYAGMHWSASMQPALRRMLLATALMAVVVEGARRMGALWMAPSWSGAALTLVGCAAVGGVVYLGMMAALGGGELRESFPMARRWGKAVEEA